MQTTPECCTSRSENTVQYFSFSAAHEKEKAPFNVVSDGKQHRKETKAEQKTPVTMKLDVYSLRFHKATKVLFLIQ